MNKDKESPVTGQGPEKRDPVLRLAVAATALGMTMGMAPAAVLGADEPPAGAGKPSMQAPEQGTDRPAAGHMKFGGVEGEVAPGKPPATMHKQQKIDAITHKQQKIGQPDAAFHKGESAPDSAVQKQEKTSKPGGPTWDLAPNKK